MEEYLDVFDENNQPTGVVLPRRQVHAEGLWHRTVHIYLFRKGADGLKKEKGSGTFFTPSCFSLPTRTKNVT
jgi:hypothetical protein